MVKGLKEGMLEALNTLQVKEPVFLDPPENYKTFKEYYEASNGVLRWGQAFYNYALRKEGVKDQVLFFTTDRIQAESRAATLYPEQYIKHVCL